MNLKTDETQTFAQNSLEENQQPSEIKFQILKPSVKDIQKLKIETGSFGKYSPN